MEASLELLVRKVLCCEDIDALTLRQDMSQRETRQVLRNVRIEDKLVQHVQRGRSRRGELSDAAASAHARMDLRTR